MLETSHPPTYYFPPGDILPGSLVPGRAGASANGRARRATSTWSAGTRGAARRLELPRADPAFAAIRGHVAFHPALVDACWVGDERAAPQEGGFYGGWITSRVVGPFKGGPGSMGW